MKQSASVMVAQDAVQKSMGLNLNFADLVIARGAQPFQQSESVKPDAVALEVTMYSMAKYSIIIN